jgi:hypothetical protein
MGCWLKDELCCMPNSMWLWMISVVLRERERGEKKKRVGVRRGERDSLLRLQGIS